MTTKLHYVFISKCLFSYLNSYGFQNKPKNLTKSTLASLFCKSCFPYPQCCFIEIFAFFFQVLMRWCSSFKFPIGLDIVFLLFAFPSIKKHYLRWFYIFLIFFTSPERNGVMNICNIWITPFFFIKVISQHQIIVYLQGTKLVNIIYW